MRNVALTAKVEVVRVSTRIPTTLTFDARLNRAAVHLGDNAPVEILAEGERSLTLRALEELSEAVTLRVPFLEGPTPTVAVFKLITETDVVDAQVLVFSNANAPELVQARLAELEARATACEAALAEQRERGSTLSPAGWVLSGQADENGVIATRFYPPSRTGTEGLDAESIVRFKAGAWVVLTVEVTNVRGPPWRPGRAWLESPSTNRRVEARRVAMFPDVLPPGATGRVAVEVGWTREESGPPGEGFRLRVQEAQDGTRALSIPGVVLEDGTAARQKSGP